MIKPTVGRRIWFWPTEHQVATLGILYRDSRQPLDAGIAYVWSDNMVNLSVSDQNGKAFNVTSVVIEDHGPKQGKPRGYAQWMPYQVNAAAKEAVATEPKPEAVTEASIEATIVAKDKIAPRVLPAQIDALVKRIQYVTNVQPGGTTSTFVHAFLDGEFFLASGHSACVDKANFDEAIGIEIARKDAEANARKKLWELEGYLLRNTLASAPIKPTTTEPVFNTEDPDHA